MDEDVKLKLKKIYAYVSLAIVSVAVVFTLFLLLKPYEVVVWNESPIQLNNYEYKVGEFVDMTSDACVVRTVDETETRFDLVIVSPTSEIVLEGDSFNIPLPELSCNRTQLKFPKLADTLGVGDYKVRVVVKSKVNSIRWITESNDSEIFKIIE